MFSSSDTANPFFHLPSSFHSPPLPFFTNTTSHSSHIFQQDPVVGRFLPATNVPISDTVISMAENGSLPTFLPKKKPAGTKKDRHSKICTTHGIRDRRVRLSIDIARKFFDLQDMLGFEKGSQTLDWLFRKSRKAIKKLAETKHSCNGGATVKTLSSASDCQVESGAGQEVNNGGADGLEKSLVGVGKSEKMKKSKFQLLAKESRAKARARARERTEEKLSKKCSHPFGESTEIKRKLRPFSSVLDYKQNPDPAISRDSSSNNNSIINNSNNNFPNLPQNWDVNRFCGITNLNLSTVLQIYGNPWEACND